MLQIKAIAARTGNICLANGLVRYGGDTPQFAAAA